jgi:hypothetical protein
MSKAGKIEVGEAAWTPPEEAVINFKAFCRHFVCFCPHLSQTTRNVMLCDRVPSIACHIIERASYGHKLRSLVNAFILEAGLERS